MNQCGNCKKNNDIEANFCCRCGLKIIKKEKCPICLEEKVLKSLMCGHNTCETCIDGIFDTSKKCAMCRADLFKCINCDSYRILINDNSGKCLDCNHELSIVTGDVKEPTSNRISCRDCNSNRLLYDHRTNCYNCMECFCKFNSGNTFTNTAQNTTKICLLCCSNDIEFSINSINEPTNKCNNCETKNTKTKTVSLEEYSRLKIKDKEEINPTFLEVCELCRKTNGIYQMSDIVKNEIVNDYSIKKINCCRNCNVKDIKIIKIQY